MRGAWVLGLWQIKILTQSYGLFLFSLSHTPSFYALLMFLCERWDGVGDRLSKKERKKGTRAINFVLKWVLFRICSPLELQKVALSIPWQKSYCGGTIWSGCDAQMYCLIWNEAVTKWMWICKRHNWLLVLLLFNFSVTFLQLAWEGCVWKGLLAKSGRKTSYMNWESWLIGAWSKNK